MKILLYVYIFEVKFILGGVIVIINYCCNKYAPKYVLA